MPDRYTVSGEGPEPLGEEFVDSSSGKDMLKEKDRLKGGGSIQAYNYDSNVSYNTISCPCSSYPIYLDSGNIKCERDDNGIKKPVNPVLINNHLIDGGIPRIGNKWLCNNIKCRQGNFEWDTLYIVKVTNSGPVGKSSSLLNSKKSILNCNIPKTSRENNLNNSTGEFEINKDNFDSIDIKHYVDGKPLYEKEDYAAARAFLDNEKAGAGSTIHTVATKYNKNGLSGWLPGRVVLDEKQITGITINGRRIFNWDTHPMSSLESLKDDDTNAGKMLFHKNGDVFKITITGLNNPMFTFSLKDSSGCDILKDKQKNVVCEGKYELSQVIPALPSGVTKEHYTFSMNIAADTHLLIDEDYQEGHVLNARIYQYKDPTYTFAVTPSTLSGVTTTSVGDSSIVVSTEPTVYQTTAIFSGNTDSKTHTTTLTHASKNLYVKNPVSAFSDIVTGSNIIKRLIINKDRTNIPETANIIVAPKPEHDANDNPIYQGDLQEGMLFNSTITKTKTIRKSVDLDIHKEPCDNCPEKNIFTNKFEIDNTNDIFEDMAVIGKDINGAEFSTFLESVDCGKSITLASSHVVNKNTDLTFKHAVSGNIIEIKDCSEGKFLTIDTGVKLPHNSEIKFENSNFSNIDGSIKNDVNGTKTVVITTTIDKIEYGQEDVTFTLDINDLVTFKPNSRDQYLTFGKNSTSNNIDYWRGSVDHSAADQSVTITQQSSNGTLTAAGKRYTYTPNHNFTGKDKIMFQLYDGSESSDEKTIFITVK